MSKFICIDWGTSNFRATLINENFQQINNIYNNQGVVNFKKNQFHEYLLKVLNTWLIKYPNIDILISGMVSSDIAWIELPHLLCDCCINDLKNNIYKIKNIKQNIYLIPGIKTNKNSITDFIRGEEIQVFGALELLKIKNATLVIPGTHSKWIDVLNNNIIDFKTNMTGDIFNAICNNTILKSNIKSKEINFEYFIKGVELSQNYNGFLNQIFQVRTNTTKDDTFSYSFLSGIIIGNEIKYMKNIFSSNDVIIISSNTLNKLYTIALNIYKINSIKISSIDANIQAFINIYKSIKR